MHWGFQDGAGVVRDVGTDPGGCRCDAGTDADAEEYLGVWYWC